MALAITPSTLHDAITDDGYWAGLSTTGGVGPVIFQLTAGTLPPAFVLSSDGRITAGHVTFTGTWPAFTITATDSSVSSNAAETPQPQVASQSFTLTAAVPS